MGLRNPVHEFGTELVMVFEDKSTMTSLRRASLRRVVSSSLSAILWRRTVDIYSDATA